MNNQILLTQPEYDNLITELEYLKTDKRHELAEKIKVARGFGDLSENSEYDEAKNEQGLVEQRIIELDSILKKAKIVNKDNISKNIVGVGVSVVVVDGDGDEDTYKIVGATGFDPLSGKISEDSPIGSALKGHKVGDKVTITLPTGATFDLTIKKIMIND